eukprot:scaffold10198_cov82-Isochrysis_galbana.AAC.1
MRKAPIGGRLRLARTAARGRPAGRGCPTRTQAGRTIAAETHRAAAPPAQIRTAGGSAPGPRTAGWRRRRMSDHARGCRRG